MRHECPGSNPEWWHSPAKNRLDWQLASCGSGAGSQDRRRCAFESGATVRSGSMDHPDHEETLPQRTVPPTDRQFSTKPRTILRPFENGMPLGQVFFGFGLPICVVRACTAHAVPRRGAHDTRGYWQLMLDASRSVLRSAQSLVVCDVRGLQCMPCHVCYVWTLLAIRSLLCMACLWVRTFPHDSSL